VLMSAVLLLMAHYTTSRGSEAADAPRLATTDADWQTYGLMIGFGLSIPIFFVTTRAWALWFLVPVIVAQIRRLLRRRQRAG
jgi:hypothetical protein